MRVHGHTVPGAASGTKQESPHRWRFSGRNPEKRGRDQQVWKKGARLRVDGTLMGVEEEGASLIPRWKRGHFSLLFDGACQVTTFPPGNHRESTQCD